MIILPGCCQLAGGDCHYPMEITLGFKRVNCEMLRIPGCKLLNMSEVRHLFLYRKQTSHTGFYGDRPLTSTAL